MSDERLDALTAWVAQTLGDPGCTLRPASSDASFRRYFRVRTAEGASFIAMDAPPPQEDCRPFVHVAAAFLKVGLNVPEIFAQQLERGFLLMSDLGDRLYLGALGEATADKLYGDAMRALVKLQGGVTDDIAQLPPYDLTLLRFEMELFREWYLQRHLDLKLDASAHAALDETFERLSDAALEQPRVAVHRDFHSRNLLVTEANNPGILDFQDAVVGPIAYDLVSLLRDCYIAWPQPKVESWVREYRALADRAGIPVGNDERRFLRWFDLIGVQRHLKAIGIFSRLNYRDGKPNYLEDIPRVLAYIRDVVGRYPELRQLQPLLAGVPASAPGFSAKPT